jgi:phage tail protein X
MDDFRITWKSRADLQGVVIVYANEGVAGATIVIPNAGTISLYDGDTPQMFDMAPLKWNAIPPQHVSPGEVLIASFRLTPTWLEHTGLRRIVAKTTFTRDGSRPITIPLDMEVELALPDRAEQKRRAIAAAATGIFVDSFTLTRESPGTARDAP